MATDSLWLFAPALLHPAAIHHHHRHNRGNGNRICQLLLKSLGSKKEGECQWAGGELERATHTARLDLLFSETQLDIQVRRADSFLPLRSARSKVESVAVPGTHPSIPVSGLFQRRKLNLVVLSLGERGKERVTPSERLSLRGMWKQSSETQAGHPSMEGRFPHKSKEKNSFSRSILCI